MFAEMYHAAFMYFWHNGPMLSLLVFSFLLAFITFIPVYLVARNLVKNNQEISITSQLLYLLVAEFVMWALILFIDNIGLGYIFSIWKAALGSLVIYYVVWWAYKHTIERYPALPWMLVQFIYIWIVYIILMYYVIYVLQIFGPVVVFSL